MQARDYDNSSCNSNDNNNNSNDNNNDSNDNNNNKNNNNDNKINNNNNDSNMLPAVLIEAHLPAAAAAGPLAARRVAQRALAPHVSPRLLKAPKRSKEIETKQNKEKQNKLYLTQITKKKKKKIE